MIAHPRKSFRGRLPMISAAAYPLLQRPVRIDMRVARCLTTRLKRACGVVLQEEKKPTPPVTWRPSTWNRIMSAHSYPIVATLQLFFNKPKTAYEVLEGERD